MTSAPTCDVPGARHRAGYADLVPGRARSAPSKHSGPKAPAPTGPASRASCAERGFRVVEVNHCDRRKRRNNGKDDTLDAESPARSVLSGIADRHPEVRRRDRRDGPPDQDRPRYGHQGPECRDRHPQDAPRERAGRAPRSTRAAHRPEAHRALRRLRPGEIIDPTASVKHSLRALAARWRTLAAEIGDHDEALDTLTRRAAPTLREVFGIGPDSAAEMMIVAGDNPTRIRSDAAFAKLCGACPIPASSGVTNRHRLFRGGHRQANAALYRIRDRPHALAPADHRLRSTSHRRGLVEERHHPLPEALRRPGGLPRTHRRTTAPVRPVPRPPDVRLRDHALDVLISPTGRPLLPSTRDRVGAARGQYLTGTGVAPREGRPRNSPGNQSSRAAQGASDRGPVPSSACRGRRGCHRVLSDRPRHGEARSGR